MEICNSFRFLGYLQRGFLHYTRCGRSSRDSAVRAVLIAVPGGHRSHPNQCQTTQALNQNLRDPSWMGEQYRFTQNRKQDARREHRKRMLAEENKRPSPTRLEPPGSCWYVAPR